VEVGDGTMIANNATVLEGAEVGSRCVVDANSLVRPRTVVPDGSFVSGNPAEVRGETRPDQLRRVELGARLQRETAAPEFYKESGDHIRGALARLDEIARELETALARWMELEEIAGRT